MRESKADKLREEYRRVFDELLEVVTRGRDNRYGISELLGEICVKSQHCEMYSPCGYDSVCKYHNFVAGFDRGFTAGRIYQEGAGHYNRVAKYDSEMKKAAEKKSGSD